jgi:hypothetical protein
MISVFNYFLVTFKIFRLLLDIYRCGVWRSARYFMHTFRDDSQRLAHSAVLAKVLIPLISVFILDFSKVFSATLQIFHGWWCVWRGARVCGVLGTAACSSSWCVLSTDLGFELFLVPKWRSLLFLGWVSECVCVWRSARV